MLVPERSNDVLSNERQRGSYRRERRRSSNGRPRATTAPGRGRKRAARTRIRGHSNGVRSPEWLNRHGNEPNRAFKADRVRPRQCVRLRRFVRLRRYVRPHRGRPRDRRLEGNAPHRAEARRNANARCNAHRPRRRRATPAVTHGRTRADARIPVRVHSSGARQGQPGLADAGTRARKEQRDRRGRACPVPLPEKPHVPGAGALGSP